MNRVDRWWNRRFPPHSVARLLFLWAATPITSLLVGGLRSVLGGYRFSWTLYWFVTVSTMFVVALAWYLGRAGYGPPLSPRSAPESSPAGTEPEPPWPRPPAPDAAPDGFAAAMHPVQPRERRLQPSDIALSMGMFFVTFLVASNLMWPEGGLGLVDVGLAVVAAALLTLVVATSFSLFALLLVAAIVSYPFALLLMLFLYWLGGGDSIWGYWLLTFSVGATIAIGMWLQIRSLKRSRRWVELPLWATTLGACVMLLLAAFTASSGNLREPRITEPAPAAKVSPTLSPYPSTPPAPTGAGSRETASQMLLAAWTAGDRAAGYAVAQRWIVDSLLAYPPDPAARFVGCGLVPGGQVRCGIETSNQLLLLELTEPAPGTFYVRNLQRMSPGYPLDREGYRRAATPAA